MKKRILLTITLILALILFIPQTHAATELTCVYNKVGSSKKYSIKYVQYKDGQKRIYRIKKDAPEIDDKDWELSPPGDTKFDTYEDFKECPSYINYLGNKTEKIKITNEDKSNDSVFCPVTIKENRILDSDKHEEYDKEWLKICQYDYKNGDIQDRIIVYLSEEDSETKIIYNNQDISKMSVGSLKYINRITKDEMMTYYNNNNHSCIFVIYENTQNLSNGVNKNYETKKTSTSSRMFVLTGEIPDSENTNPQDPNDGDNIKNCEEMIGEETVNLINDIFKWVRIIVPLLLIGRGLLDFGTAIFSKSEEDMNKIRDKFIKRVIAAIIVFFIPIFVNVLLDVANSVWSDINPNTCIK